MEIDIFQIDAFTDTLFNGNPAAVCPLDAWIADELLLKIAQENNLAETAFFIPLETGQYHLRWFTPEFEMDLCGHATLASAFVLREELAVDREKIIFKTKSGELSVTHDGTYYCLNFPSRVAQKSTLPKEISNAINVQAKEVWKARDYLLLYESEEDIKTMAPDMSLMHQINIDPGGIIVTAKSEDPKVDFVSRFFTPQASIFEDPVTGSAHCTLIPFWAERLNKKKMRALQISERGGEILCTLDGDRVHLQGKAVKFMHGKITI